MTRDPSPRHATPPRPDLRPLTTQHSALSTQHSPPGPLAGTLRFIRYAFMPNRLQYCGGDDNHTLFEHAVARQPEPGLHSLLRKFTGAYPYLRLIARSAGI